MQIKPGQYKTKAGYDAQVVAVKEYGAIGWIEGGWPMAWHSSGAVYRFTSGSDLLSIDWRDEIPWVHIRNGIARVARDEVGGWHGYQREPKPGENEWIPVGYEAIKVPLHGIKMPDGPDNWREALAERPGDW